MKNDLMFYMVAINSFILIGELIFVGYLMFKNKMKKGLYL